MNVSGFVNIPIQFAAYIVSETARYANVVKDSGARVD